MTNGNIFISYRREDSAGHARLVWERLKVHFPGRVFMDVADINLGDDFVEAIERKVSDCGVFLELIGNQWETITDPAGKRRLEDPEDWVRLEVATALRRSITVIPVLVDGAAMPDESALPPDIAPLTRHNALEITESDFDHDVDRLIERLKTVVGPGALRTNKSQFRRRVLIIGMAVAGLFVIGGLVIWHLFSGNATQPPKVNPHPVVNFKNEVDANTNITSPTPEVSPVPRPVPPPGTVEFVNSINNLDGRLMDHYADFSFYYPKSWRIDPNTGVSGATNFVQVERFLPPDFTQEIFAVGWYSSIDDSGPGGLHSLAENLSLKFEKSNDYPGYRKVSEGPTKVGRYDGYEFRFEGLSPGTARGDIKIWGRVIFVPPADRNGHAVTISMVATSLAPGLQSVNDVGEKGQTPMILRSFRLGTTR